MTRRRPARRERGFTLVELMVAMVVFALIAAGTWAALGLASRSVEAGVAESEARDEVRVVQGLLRRLLAGAVPVAVVAERGREFHVWFVGDDTSMAFAAAAPAWLAGGGLHRYGLTVQARDDGSRRLLLRRARLDLGEDPQPPGDDDATTVLADDLVSLRVEYYGDPEDTGLGEWLDRWPEARRLPALIRLNVATRASGAWPELVLAPRVDDPLFPAATPDTVEVRTDGQ